MTIATERLDAQPDLETVIEPVVAGRRRHRRNLLDRGWTRVLSPLVLLGLWQLVCQAGWVNPFELSSPWRVAREFGTLTANGQLPDALAVSLRRVVIGLAIGVAIGVVLALISGLSRVGERLVDTPVQMVRTLPILAMLPLFIIWFGIGEEEKSGIIAFIVVFPIYLNTYGGIRNVDGRLIEVGQILGLSRVGMIRHVILPGVLPNFLIGLRMALTFAWLALVVAEQVNTTSGIGYLMIQAQSTLQIDIILVGLTVYAFLGLIADFAVRQIEKRALRWRRSFVGA